MAAVIQFESGALQPKMYQKLGYRLQNPQSVFGRVFAQLSASFRRTQNPKPPRFQSVFNFPACQLHCKWL